MIIISKLPFFEEHHSYKNYYVAKSTGLLKEYENKAFEAICEGFCKNIFKFVVTVFFCVLLHVHNIAAHCDKRYQ